MRQASSSRRGEAPRQDKRRPRRAEAAKEPHTERSICPAEQPAVDSSPFGLLGWHVAAAELLSGAREEIAPRAAAWSGRFSRFARALGHPLELDLPLRQAHVLHLHAQAVAEAERAA